MQYALMIYAEPGYHEALRDAERAAARADFLALADDARCVGTVQLQSAETATCVRVAGGRTLMTDGPFADTKEVLGGVHLVEAPNLDEAIELAGPSSCCGQGTSLGDACGPAERRSGRIAVTSDRGGPPRRTAAARER
jgi:hypothetical protein